MRVTMRDSCKDKREDKKFSKASRQCKIQPRIFDTGAGDGKYSEAVEVAFGLVSKMVNYKEEFMLTLLGVTVTDFTVAAVKKGSIKGFFSSRQPRNILGSTDTAVSKLQGASASDCLKRSRDAGSPPSSPVFKKSKRSEAAPKQDHDGDAPPPTGCDPEVWAALPADLQTELRMAGTQSTDTSEQGTSFSGLEETPKVFGSDNQNAHSVSTMELKCPPGIDPEVFKTLPKDIRDEIEADARVKSSRTSSSGANTKPFVW